MLPMATHSQPNRPPSRQRPDAATQQYKQLQCHQPDLAALQVRGHQHQAGAGLDESQGQQQAEPGQQGTQVGKARAEQRVGNGIGQHGQHAADSTPMPPKTPIVSNACSIPPAWTRRVRRGNR